MNRQQAKETLLLYRPGSADDEDPAFGAALRLCEEDPELRTWFSNHCAVYLALRDKLKQIAVPEALKEQILAERKVHVSHAPRRPMLLVALAAVAVLALLAVLWMPRGDDRSLTAFREQMVSRALRTYRMDLETDKLDRVRSYLSLRNGQSDFVLPAGLHGAKVMGCVAATWHGRPVAMICFNSGRPGTPGTSDLWLFVTEQASVTDGPAASPPSVATVHSTVTATWTAEGKIYLLATEGDEALLRKFL